MKKIFVKLLAVLLIAILALPLLTSCFLEGEQGEAGPAGEAGKDGAAGKSAYELAVEKGFNGTLEEWVASLAGANGAVGATGVAGKDGEDGEDGADGRIGFVVSDAEELQAALCVNNAYVVLARDITLSGNSFKAFANVVLNLNGKTLSSDFGLYTIDVQKNATLTLIGEGTVTNTNNYSSTIRNYGTLIIGEEGVEAAPVVTMTAKLNANHSAVKCEELSVMIIYNGTFEGQDRSVQSWGTTVICGGTFTKSVEAWEWKEGETVYESSLTILGGTFLDAIDGEGIDPAGADCKATVSIYGGTFAADPTTYVADGYTAQALPENAGYKVVVATPAA